MPRQKKSDMCRNVASLWCRHQAGREFYPNRRTAGLRVSPRHYAPVLSVKAGSSWLSHVEGNNICGRLVSPTNRRGGIKYPDPIFRRLLRRTPPPPRRTSASRGLLSVRWVLATSSLRAHPAPTSGGGVISGSSEAAAGHGSAGGQRPAAGTAAGNAERSPLDQGVVCRMDLFYSQVTGMNTNH